MNKEIDIDALLAPIPGDNPAGEDLRYTRVYDDIKEARREDDLSALSGGKAKSADWNKVFKLSVEALEKKSKDLQIAAWLAESLIRTEGFNGLSISLRIFTSLLRDYWENLYPLIEEGDLDYRIGPLEFMNEKLSLSIKHIPITNTGTTPGYSWFKWDESRVVGYEKDTLNSFGDVDMNKKAQRDDLISEGKLTAEEFDSAVGQSSEVFCESLAESLKMCSEAFRTFDETIDGKFGSDAPRLAEIRSAIEDCEQLVKGLYKDKIKSKPEEPEPLEEEDAVSQAEEKGEAEEEVESSCTPGSGGQFTAKKFPDEVSVEKAVWEESLKMLKSGGINKALKHLYETSNSMPSVREQNRFRLLMTKLCLMADRPDLARPIIEQLHALIEELNLERWESPMWIAEVLESLYKCLTTGTVSDEDTQRAEELFKKICRIDVTKAVTYRA